MKHRAFLSQLDNDRIRDAIREAELQTSGEIRVLISRHKIEEPLMPAQKAFERLGMTRTRHRNAVLIFVAPRSRKFAIIGDKGIHEKCGLEFWQSIAVQMEKEFKAGRFMDGLVAGILKTGEQLRTHFPHHPEDVNELPDSPVED